MNWAVQPIRGAGRLVTVVHAWSKDFKLCHVRTLMFSKHDRFNYFLYKFLYDLQRTGHVITNYPIPYLRTSGLLGSQHLSRVKAAQSAGPSRPETKAGPHHILHWDAGVYRLEWLKINWLLELLYIPPVSAMASPHCPVTLSRSVLMDCVGHWFLIPLDVDIGDKYCTARPSSGLL